MNFSDDYIKKFDDNNNFLRYSSDLIDKIKLRIKEKLINSFILRIEREKNVEKYINEINNKQSENFNISEYFFVNKNDRNFLSNENFEIFKNLNENLNYTNFQEKSNINNNNNFLNYSKLNNSNTNNNQSSGNYFLNKNRKKNLLNSYFSSKKFIDFTTIFLTSIEEFQSKFNEREIIQFIKNFDESKKRNKIEIMNKDKSKIKDNLNGLITIKNKKNVVESFISNENYKNENEKDYENPQNSTVLLLKDNLKKIFKKRRIGKVILYDEIQNSYFTDFNYDISESKINTRKIRFFIDLENDCDVYINDTIYYEKNNESNLIDHLILNNNNENIEPRSINSETRNINFFIFNRRLNMFSVNTELNMEKLDTKFDNFDINYEYMVHNLIKSREIIFKKNYTNILNNDINFYEKIKIEKNLSQNLKNFSKNTEDEDYFWKNIRNSYLFDNITTFFFKNLRLENYGIEKSVKKINEFIWKINNEIIDKKVFLEIEFLFSLGEDFEYDKINFNFKTTRSIKELFYKKFHIFTWKGVLLPYEVKNIKCAFPMSFECKNKFKNDLSIFILLFLFIIFLILILYSIRKMII